MKLLILIIALLVGELSQARCYMGHGNWDYGSSDCSYDAKSPAVVVNKSTERVLHMGECTIQEIRSGYNTGTKWFNGGLAGPTPKIVCLYPTQTTPASATTPGADPFAVGCLNAKQAFGIPATLGETDKWSTRSITNGHDEWSWSARCDKKYSNQRFISLRVLKDNEYQACAVYDTLTKKYNYDFVDRFIQNPQIQFQSCLKSVYLKLQITR